MENLIFLLKMGSIPAILFFVFLIKNFLYETKSRTIFIKKIRKKNIQNIDIVIDRLYYSMEKQQIIVEVQAGYFVLRLKPFYYKNLRFSTYEFAARAQGYILALIEAHHILVSLIKLGKKINITINGESIDTAKKELNNIMKDFDKAYIIEKQNIKNKS